MDYTTNENLTAASHVDHAWHPYVGTGGWPGGKTVAPRAKGHDPACCDGVLEAPNAHDHQVAEARSEAYAANGHAGGGDAAVIRSRGALGVGQAELHSADAGAEDGATIRQSSSMAAGCCVLGSVADATSRPRACACMSERWRTELIIAQSVCLDGAEADDCGATHHRTRVAV